MSETEVLRRIWADLDASTKLRREIADEIDAAIEPGRGMAQVSAHRLRGWRDRLRGEATDE